MSFPRYPRYKDSGVEWLGEVPEHWSLSRTKNLFTLMKRPPLDEDDIVTAFRDGEVTLRSKRRVDGFTNSIHEHGYQRVLSGDLVIHAMDAFAGAIGVSDSTGKSTPVYSVCQPRSPFVNVIYFARLLRHMALSGYINSLSKGIRERSTEFRWSEAANVLVAFPPVAEQDVIVSFLDGETTKIDTLIAEQRRLIDLLKEKRQTIISHAVTKGLNPDVPMKPSGIAWLGDVPAHWVITTVRRTIKRIEQGWSPECENRPAEPNEWGVLKAGCVNRGVFVEQENKALPESLEPIRQYEVRRGDVLMSRASGSPDLVGSTALVESDRTRLMLSDKIFRIHLNPAVDKAFFVALFNSRIMRAQIENAISGAEGLANNLPQSAMKAFFCAIPPIVEQKSVSNYLEVESTRFNSLIAEAERAIELLQERRTALISAAVTGKIDVRGLAEAA